jgi:S1-C subfamily serine protease
VTRILVLLAALLGLLAAPSPARAQDDVSAASRSVVRVVVVQLEGEEIVDFGHGSGFAVAPNRIVTNAHVVALAVSNPDGVAIGIVPSEGSQSYGARIVAVDPARDLALLEMQDGRVPPVALFTGRLAAGAPVAALGYPGNVDLATAQSMQDYITPLPPTRSMGNYSDQRQGDSGATLVHTADIARGHSGGPLVDICGRVIGVNRMITRNDMGDSTFGFAIPVSALIQFLREARQAFGGIDTPCVSSEERERIAAEQEAAERRAREADEASRRRGAEEREARRLAALQEQRENRLAIAIGLLVLALAAMGATFLLLVRNQPRPALAAGAVAVLLLVGAAIVFFTRPGLDDSGGGGGAEVAGTAGANDRFVGANLCTLDEARSRVTVSTEREVELDWSPGGCVNGETQYAEEGGVWRRVLVPSREQTVNVTQFDPATGDYVVNRYLLSAEAMEEARRLRRRVEQNSCTADPEARAALAEQLRPLIDALPERPNERLVFRCAATER